MCCGKVDGLEIDNGWVNRLVYLDFSGLNASIFVLCGLVPNPCWVAHALGVPHPVAQGWRWAVDLPMHHTHALRAGRLKMPRPVETHHADAGNGAIWSGVASAGQ